MPLTSCHLIWAPLLCCALCACGGRTTTPTSDNQAATDDTEVDTGKLSDSGQAPDTTAIQDANVNDVVASFGEPFGPCDDDDNCDLKLCMEMPKGRICAKKCGECPAGFGCESFGSGADAFKVCKPMWSRLCRPCKNDDDCRDASQLSGGWCIDYGHAGAFCGGDCVAGECPKDYTCRDVTTTTGVPRKQCVRADLSGDPQVFGACVCNEHAFKASAQTPCATDLWQDGKCWCAGQRFCGKDGLTQCASTPGASCAPSGCDICAKDADCKDDGDLCNGLPVCVKTPGKPAVCQPNTKDAVQCDPGQDTACLVNTCAPQTGKCAPKPTAENTPCKDGDACTYDDRCKAGTCTGAAAVCCTNADCAPQDDGKLCNGTKFCEAPGSKDAKCTFNPATVKDCSAVGQAPCLVGACVEVVDLAGKSTSTACQAVPAPGALTCDDGKACTTGDVCQNGSCKGTQTGCCEDADCAKDEDGDACNGRLFCNKQSGKCLVNPATKVACPTGADTDCVHNSCAKATGVCSMLADKDGSTCSDGNLCTGGDTCKDGACYANPDLANACTCTEDVACAPFEDKSVCNGTLFCDKTAGACVLNPATVVLCDATDDLPCRTNTCHPDTGACAMADRDDGALCDDGNPCTVSERCQTAGNTASKCISDAAVPSPCACTATADCAKFEDGDACNGTLFCNGQTGLCAPDPASVVVCQSAGNSKCRKNLCDTKTGQCALLDLPNGTNCEDGDACTKAAGCKDGECAGLAGVSCNDGNVCTNDVCDPIKGCVNTANQAFCADNDACTTDERCANKLCLAKNRVCDDNEPCTTDSCDPTATDPTKACIFAPLPTPVTCTDNDPCTENDRCGGGKCAPGKTKDCDDGDACTAGDKCVGGQCFVGGKTVCHDTNPCTADSCDPKTGKCVFQAQTGAVCDDGSACTDDDACAKGQCVGKPLLWDRIYGLKGASISAGRVAVMSDGDLVLIAHHGEKMGGWVARADERGALKWEKAARELFAGDTVLPHGVTAVADGSAVVVVESAPNKPANAETGWIVRLDATGKVSWQHPWQAGNGGALMDVCASDGGVLAVGRTRATNPAGDGAVLALSASGKLTYARRVRCLGKHSGAFRAVAKGHGGFAAAGVCAVNGQANNGWLIGFDAAGQTRWELAPGTLEHEQLEAIEAVTGGWTAVGKIMPSAADRTAWLLHVDVAGRVAWQRQVAGAHNSFDAIVAAPDGGVLAVGSTAKDRTATSDAWLVKFDATGRQVWDRRTGEATEADGIASVVRRGNGYLAGGYSWLADGTGVVRLQRVDAWGQADCATSGGCAAKAVVGCADGEVCTDDLCSVANKGCYNADNSAFCDDGDACTVASVCAKGTCVSGTPRVWQRELDGKTFAWATDVQAAAGGGIVAAGYTNTGSGKGHAWAQRVGADGAAQGDPLIIDGPRVDVAESLARVADGWLLAGFEADTPDKESDLWVARTGVELGLLWTRRLTGTYHHSGRAVTQLPDGRVAVVGESGATSSETDGLLVLMPASGVGAMQQHVMGNDAWGSLRDVVPAATGGLALAGYTIPKPGGSHDFWLVRCADDGHRIWERTYGGAGTDQADRIVPADDGGFWLIGTTTSVGAGKQDAWVVRTDAAGALLWSRTVGGAGIDAGNAAALTHDGGLLIGGGRVPELAGEGPTPAWVARLDGLGHVAWERTLGKTGRTTIYGLAADSTGGFTAAGYTQPGDATTRRAWIGRMDTFGDTTCDPKSPCAAPQPPGCDDHNPCTLDTCDATKGCENAPIPDLSRCDDGQACTLDGACEGAKCAVGKPRLWARSFAGNGTSRGRGLAMLTNGDVAVTGELATAAGDINVWAGRIDRAGQALWTRSLGGAGDDSGQGVLALSGGGIAVAGARADVKAGHLDGWLVVLDGQGNTTLDVAPDKGPRDAAFYALQAHKDGGFALAGATRSYSNTQQAWLLITDAKGAAQKNVRWGSGQAGEPEYALDLTPTSTGYAIVGYGATGRDVGWLRTVDADGALVGKQPVTRYDFDDGTVVTDVETPGNGDLVLAATATAGGTNQHVGMVLRTTADGTLIWHKTLALTRSTMLIAVTVRPDGLIVGVGSDENRHTAPIWLLTGGGDVIAQHDATSPTAQTWNDVAWVGDGLVLSGVTRPNLAGHTEIAVARADSWGHTDCKKAGKCAQKQPWDCDDSISCTVDRCDAKQGCVHDAAACCGTDKDCDDGNACTVDVCDAAAGCSIGKGPDDATCGDGCTAVGTCKAGVCTGAGPRFDGTSLPVKAPDGSFRKSACEGIAVAHDGGVVLACHDWTGATGSRARAVALKPGGTEIKIERSLGLAKGTSSAIGIARIDGTSPGYAVVGWIDHDPATDKRVGGITDLWTARLDAELKPIWQRADGLGPDHHEQAEAVAVTSTRIIAAGMQRPKGGNADGWVVATSLTGNPLWQRKVRHGTGIDWLHDVIASEKAGIVAVGTLTDPPTGKTDGWVVGVTLDGDVVWRRAIGEPDRDEGLQAVARLPGGELVACGASIQTGSKSRGLVVRLDPLGYTRWRRTFPLTDDAALRGIWVRPGGGVVLVGREHLDTIQNADMWLLELDEAGAPVWQQVLDIGPNTSTPRGAFLEGVVGTQAGLFGTGAFANKTDAHSYVQWTDHRGQSTLGRPCDGLSACAPNAARCDDNNPCTNDRCDDLLGCVYADNSAPCDDDTACTATATCTQGKCVASPDPRYWQRNIGAVTDWTAGRGVAQPDANTIIVGGFTGPRGEKASNPALWQLDAAGQVVATAVYDTGTNHDHPQALAAGAKRFVLAGRRGTKVETFTAMCFSSALPVTAAGATVVTLSGDFDRGEGIDIVPVPNGGFALAGWGRRTSTGKRGTALARLDADCKALTTALHREDDAYALALALAPDGRTLLAGRTFGTGKGDDVPMWLVVDTKNAVVAEKKLADTGSVTDAERWGDGWLLVGNTRVAGGERIWLRHERDDGQPYWTRSYASLHSEAAQAVAVGPTGFALFGASRYHAHVLLTDHAGKLTARKTWPSAGYPWADELAGAIATGDGWLAVGQHGRSTANNSDALVIRMSAAAADCDGHPPPNPCVGKPAGATCDDGLACTHTDRCSSIGLCRGDDRARESEPTAATGAALTVADLPANKLLVGGWQDAPGQSQNGWLAVIGDNGLAEKNGELLTGGAQDDVFSAVAPLGDGRHAAAGSRDADGWKTVSRGWLALGKPGSWKLHEYAAPGGFGYLSGVAASGADIAVVGTRTDTKGGDRRGWLLVVNDAGKIKTGCDNAVNTGFETKLQAIAPAATGWLAVGNRRATSDGDYGSLIARFGADCKPKWQQLVTGEPTVELWATLPLGPGHVVAGAKGKHPYDQDAWLMAIDGAGKPLWQWRGRNDSSEPGQNAAYAVIRGLVVDGNALVAVGRRGVGATLAGWTGRWTLAGAPLSDATVDMKADRTLFGIAARADGDLALVGYRLDAAKKHVAVLQRTDAWGHVTCATAGLCGEVTPTDCDDANSCTLDACDPGHGCTHVARAGGCESGNCTGGDACKNGLCAAGDGPKLFDRTYAAGQTTPRGVAVLADGSVAVVGQRPRATTGTGDDARLVHVSASGQVLLDHTYTNIGSGSGLASVSALGDATVLAGGYGDQGKGDGSDAMLGWLDTNTGTATWRFWGGAEGDYIEQALAIDADTAVAVGRTSSLGKGKEDGLLLRWEAGKWTVARTYGSANGQRFMALAMLDDGGAVAAGYGHPVPITAGEQGWIVRTQSSGDALWERYLGGPRNDLLHAVVALPSGDVLVAGRQQDPSALWRMQGWLARLRKSDGEPVWQHVSSDPASTGYHTIGLLADGSLLLAGERAMTETAIRGFVAQADENGMFRWQKTLGDRFDRASLNALALGPDGFVLAGVARHASQPYAAWLVRADAWGNTACGASGGCDRKQPYECDDGLACTLDFCAKSACQHVAQSCCKTDAQCDDGNVCTVDTCGQTTSCEHKPVAGKPLCADGDPCSLDGSCAGGVCADIRTRLWQRTIAAAASVELAGAAWLADGSGLVVGDITGGGQPGTRGLAERIAADGSTVWRYEHAVAGATVNFTAAVRDQTGWHVGGQINPGKAGGRDGLVIELDASGKLLASGTWGTGKLESLHAAFRFKDGRVAFVGDTDAGQNGDMWMLVHHANGQVTEHLIGGDSEDNAGAATALGAGGVLAGSGHANDGLPGARLARVNSSGSPLWQRMYLPGNRSSLSKVTASGPDVIASGSWRPTKTGAQRPLVMRVDANGTLRWWRTYPSGGDADSGGGLAVDDQGRIHFSVHRRSGAGPQAVHLLGLDGAGAMLWDRSLDANGVSWSFDLASTAGATLTAVGFTTPTAGQPSIGRLIRTDPFGNPTCTWNGACASPNPPTCDDNNPCTNDTCDAQKGCIHAPNAAPCEAGTCTTNDRCDQGKCVAGWNARYWQRTLALHGATAAGAITAAGDGGLAVVVDTPAGGPGFEHATPILHWLNADGQPTGHLVLGGKLVETIAAIVPTTDGGYGLVGYLSEPQGTEDWWFVRLGNDGKILGNTRTQTGTSDQLQGAVAVAGGEVVAAGSRKTNGWQAQLIRYDAKGKLAAWHYQHAGAGSFLNDIVVADSGEFAAVGHQQVGGVSQGGLFIRVDKDGKPLQSLALGGKGASLRAVARYGEGFVIAGETQSATAGPSDAIVHRLDAKGAPLWSSAKSYGGQGREGAYDVAIGTDGSILVWGLTSTGADDGKNDRWLLRLSDDGKLLNTRQFKLSGEDGAGAILALADGDLLLTGTVKLPEKVGWVARVNANGEAVCKQPEF